MLYISSCFVPFVVSDIHHIHIRLARQLDTEPAIYQTFSSANCMTVADL